MGHGWFAVGDRGLLRGAGDLRGGSMIVIGSVTYPADLLAARDLVAWMVEK